MQRRFRIATFLALPWLAPGAGAEVAVVVGPDSAVQALSADEVAQVFLGKSDSAGGASVSPLDLLEGDATRDEFYEKAAGRSASQLKAYWSKLVFTGKGEPPEAVDPEELVDRLLDEPDAVGYLPGGSVPGNLRVVLTLP
jgi:hypothetical protein